MISDLFSYFSGNVAGGLVLLASLVVSYTAILCTVWLGTRFWKIGRFFIVLVVGWMIIVGIYFVVWKNSHPSPIPIRVIVVADDNIDSFEKWKVFGVVDCISKRLTASSKHFVIQHPKRTVLLAKERFNEQRLDKLAFTLRASWLIIVTPQRVGLTFLSDSVGQTLLSDTINQSFPIGRVRQDCLTYPSGRVGQECPTYYTIYIKQRSGDGFDLVKTLTTGDGSFASEVSKLCSEVMRQMGDKKLPLGRYGLPPNLPDEAFERFYHAILLRDDSKNDSATAVFTSLIETYPDWHRLHQELAITHLGYYSSYYRDKIHKLLLTSLELDSSDPENYILLGYYFLHYLDWFEAESALKLALNVTIDDPRIFYYLSRLGINRVKDLPWSSRNELKIQALKMEPGYEAVRLSLAESFRDKLDRYHAIATLEEGIELDSLSILLLLAKAGNLVEMDYQEEAIAVCDRILELNPDNTDALYNMGIAKVWLGALDEGIALLDSCYRNDGTIESLYYLGVAYQKKHDWKTAIHYFQQRMVRPKHNYDRVVISSRERIKALRIWIAEEDSVLKRTKDENEE
ncbi:MAG: tetratricopeptide repeat protein [Candidatus Hatepunaea meridiana]|nr:tetratricopeptide repeat protein [Candidatus Hatepunaea meridiana]